MAQKLTSEPPHVAGRPSAVPASTLNRSGFAGHHKPHHVFTQWIAAVQAEAAVLADAPDAGTLLAQAHAASAGNPVATAITRRAAGLRSADRAALEAVTAEFTAAGSGYQLRAVQGLQSRKSPAGGTD